MNDLIEKCLPWARFCRMFSICFTITSRTSAFSIFDCKKKVIIIKHGFNSLNETHGMRFVILKTATHIRIRDEQPELLQALVDASPPFLLDQRFSHLCKGQNVIRFKPRHAAESLEWRWDKVTFLSELTLSTLPALLRDGAMSEWSVCKLGSREPLEDRWWEGACPGCLYVPSFTWK